MIQSIDVKNGMVCIEGRWIRKTPEEIKKLSLKRDFHLNDIYPNKLLQYRAWLAGQSDRLNNKPCISTNGKYLDGWYSPEKIIPDFLTHDQAAIVRRYL